MMAMVRIFGLSMLTSMAAAGVAMVLFRGPYSDFIIPTLLFASVGAMVGVVGGAAVEIVMALRHGRSN